jgi:phage-related protein
MSEMTYTPMVSPKDKPLAWLHGELKTPPLSREARLEAGFLLRRLQRRELLSMPQSRPMPSIGARCHELRVNDASSTWRVVYRIDKDAILVLEVFAKRTRQTPAAVIATCQMRMKEYDRASK